MGDINVTQLTQPQIEISHNGKDITIQETIPQIVIGAPTPVAGENNTAANVGAGAGIFRDKTGVTINLRSIVGVNGATASVVGDTVEIDVAASGDVDGPASSIDNELTLFDGTTGKLIKGGSGFSSTGSQMLAPDGAASTPSYTFGTGTDVGLFHSGTGIGMATAGTEQWTLDATGNLVDPTGANLVDGVDVSAHVSRHELGGADELSVAGLSGTLADPQTPSAHATTHQNSGSDELDLTGLSGLLGDAQTPLPHNSTHANGGSDELSVLGLSGLLADAQTPLAHSSTHEFGGSDVINVANLSGQLADPQTPITHSVSHQDGGSDELDVTNLSGLLGDPQTPLAHAGSHFDGGSDPLNAAALGSGAATNGQVLTANGIGGNSYTTVSVSDELVGVTAADTVPGYLDAKLVAGTGISTTVLNPAADEDLEINVVGFTETGGPTALTYAAVPDTFVMVRSGTTVIGVDPTTIGAPLTSTAPVDVDTAAAAVGVSTEAARQDHKHDIDTTNGAISTVNAGDAASEGAGTGLSRRDHQHAVSTAAPTASVDAGDAAAEGVATSLARSDHQHAVSTGGALSTIQPDDIAAEGTSTNLAREDHVHAIVAAAPSAGIGAGNTEGVSTSFARADHDHTIRTTTGPTDLTVAAIPDTFLLSRSGTTIVGLDPASVGTTDHGALSGLGDDDHTQYLLLANRAGGQLIGSQGVDRILSIEDSTNTERIRIGEDTDALMLMTSTTQGFRPPTMTEAQRDLIGTPSTGLVIYNTDDNQLNQYTGSTWTIPGAGLTTLQSAYDNSPSGAQIALNATPDPITIQGTVAGTVFSLLDVGGSSIMSITADPDAVSIEGTLTIDDPFLNAAAVNSLVMSDTFTTGAGFLGGGILSNGTITYDNSFFIWALLQESKVYNAAAGPGFAAFTLFNALPVIQNSGNFDLVQALVLNAGVLHARVSSGTSTTTQVIGLSFVPQIRGSVSGAVMTKSTGDTAVRCAPTFSTVAGSTINGGTTIGLQCAQPAVALFQTAAGVENYTAYYGVDFAAMTHVTSGDKVVVRSAMTDAADRFFLQNNGGARSDFGGGLLLDCGIIQILADNTSLSLGAGGGDVQINWNGSALEFDPVIGSDMRTSFAAGSHTITSASVTDELRFGYERGYHFGSTGALGNQFCNFAAPARTTDVAGEWVDILLTQAGNLTIDHAMTSINAWAINPVSLTSGAGSLTGEVTTLVIGGMTTSGLGGNPTSALRVNGRTRQRGSLNFEPISPAQLTADADNSTIMGTGSAQRSVVRVSSDASRTISGFDIDATTVRENDTIWLVNVGSNDVVLGHQDAGSDAENRIISPTGANLTLNADESALLWYDDTDDRWRILYHTGA